MLTEVPPLPPAAETCPYTPPEFGCTTGTHCGAPPDMDLPNSTHHCFNCAGLFHSELFCTMKLHDLKQKMKKQIRKELLSLQMYQRWMDEFSVLAANEEAKLQENASIRWSPSSTLTSRLVFVTNPFANHVFIATENVWLMKIMPLRIQTMMQLPSLHLLKANPPKKGKQQSKGKGRQWWAPTT